MICLLIIRARSGSVTPHLRYYQHGRTILQHHLLEQPSTRQLGAINSHDELKSSLLREKGRHCAYGLSEVYNNKKHTLLGQRIPILGEIMTVYMTKRDRNNKHCSGSPPPHGTEVVSTAMLINTLYHGTGRNHPSKVRAFGD